MARIRAVEIENFRGIKSLTWFPLSGINCLIGAGDSGKSTLLEAIDLCLGARRNLTFTDADFHALDASAPIRIAVTLGELGDQLKNFDVYGIFLRGFLDSPPSMVAEPQSGAETVLTIQLAVASDLEPTWSLFSERASALDETRFLHWGHRALLAPTRIGVGSSYNLAWRHGSVLNRLSEVQPDASAALLAAVRSARAAVGAESANELGPTMALVADTARELGIPIGRIPKAMLDPDSVSFGGGMIALHSESGIPLGHLGSGSVRLLIAGLQRRAAAASTMVLIDELEHGLEPHRIIRLLDSLGAKEAKPPLQVIMTTHSPVAVRELAASQLFVLRAGSSRHECLAITPGDVSQGTIRLYPEAFLASTVIVCEGASEVGFLRGIDRFRARDGRQSIAALGVALVDARGADNVFGRALSFQELAYRTAAVRDDDTRPTPDLEERFKDNGGFVFAWRSGRTLEDELFLSLSGDGVRALLNRAVELHGEDQISATISSTSAGNHTVSSCLAESSQDVRALLGKCARTRHTAWFKSITAMEDVARDIVGPDLANADADFRAMIANVFAWASNDDS